MAEIKDGGAAFPSFERVQEWDDSSGRYRDYYLSVEGMKLRDWFAGQALHEAAGAVCDDLSENGDDGAREHAARHAKAAYLLADAMVAERKKGGA